MIEPHMLAWTVGIFASAYFIVTRRPIGEAIGYGVLAAVLEILAVAITPPGATVFNNLKTIIIIFIGINAISQVFYRNPLKQDITISITALALNLILITGGVINV